MVSIAKGYLGAARSSTDQEGSSASSGGREVRLPQGFQVLDLRHLVDPLGRDRAIADSPHDRIPVHMVEKLNKVVHPTQPQRLGRAARRGDR